MSTLRAPRPSGDPVHLSALLIALLPVMTVNACLLLSIQAETIPSCIPYFEGCTSVSAAGRNPPAIYLFRGVMLPVAAALILFWIVNVRWLRLLRGNAASTSGGGMLWLGIIGAVFLAVYVSFLGSEGDFARLMRRYGIYVYFGFTALAQLLTGRELLHIGKDNADQTLRRYGRTIVFLCLLMLVSGITNVILKAVLADPDQAENVIEWNFAVLMQAYFLVCWFAWRHSGLRTRLELKGSAGEPTAR